jgi:hypothetical protein
MTGEPVMRTALVRREQAAGERAVSAAGVAELADERCFGPFEAKLREGPR